MEEARAVLARLERIEALERAGAGVQSLLAELRELVREAGVWAERERDPRAQAAVAALSAAEEPRVAAARPAVREGWESALRADRGSELRFDLGGRGTSQEAHEARLRWRLPNAPIE